MRATATNMPVGWLNIDIQCYSFIYVLYCCAIGFLSQSANKHQCYGSSREVRFRGLTVSNLIELFHFLYLKLEFRLLKAVRFQLGYWTDNFIRKFAVGCGIEPSVRRDPEISIGYWARVSMVWKVIENFLSKTNGTGQLVNIGGSNTFECILSFSLLNLYNCLISFLSLKYSLFYIIVFVKAGNIQLFIIGCGFDTLYWRLKEDGRKFSKFVDMDFSSVTAKKIRQIRKPGEDFAKFFAGEGLLTLFFLILSYFSLPTFLLFVKHRLLTRAVFFAFNTIF